MAVIDSLPFFCSYEVYKAKQMYYNVVANRFASGQRITFLGRVMQRGSEKERKELTNEESNKKGIVGLYKEEQYASILCK